METYEYSRRNGSNWQKYLLIIILVAVGGYLVLYSDYKGDIRGLYADIKPSLIKEQAILIYELEIKTDTGYVLGENEAVVKVYGYREVTYNISENESKIEKEYGRISSKKIDINKRVVLEDLISGNTYSIQIHPLYNSIEFYPQNYSILVNRNETGNTLIVKERADFKPLNLRLRNSLEYNIGSNRWVLNEDKDYSFIFGIQTEGKGQVLCPEISFMTNDSKDTYITMWVKAGDLISLPDGRIKFGEEYLISDMFTREMYSSVILDIRNLQEGVFEMAVGDCKGLTKRQVEFIVE